MKFKPTSLSWLIPGASVSIFLLLFLLTHAIKIPRTVLVPVQPQAITWLSDRRLALPVPPADQPAVEQAEKIYLIGKGLRQEVFKDRWIPGSPAQLRRLEISLPAKVKLADTQEASSLTLECNLPGESFWKKIIQSIF